MIDNNPIIAISTPPGKGGVGIIRISGKNLSSLIQNLFKKDLLPRYAYHLPFVGNAGNLVDKGIVIFFQSPNSYTGEDVLELHGHGSPVVLREILNLCVLAGKSLGIRLAEPGEFTQRAFLNGQIDLAQAEAVADLIESSSKASAHSAINSLSGIFSSKVNTISNQLFSLRTFIEAILEFPEEIESSNERDKVHFELQSIIAGFDELIAKSQQGLVLRDGLRVVLIGQPNVGKSSLLNSLCKEEIAIVTSIPGTTRDRISQEVYIGNLLMCFVDTAGLHETVNPIEKIGIEKTLEEIKRADIILHVMDITKHPNKFDEEIASSFPKKTPILKIFNKIDLMKTLNVCKKDQEMVNISIVNEIGLDLLHEKLLNIAECRADIESSWLARKRHINALEKANEHLRFSMKLMLEQKNPFEFLSEELKLAYECLGFITGKTTTENLLNEIFSSFCIGK